VIAPRSGHKLAHRDVDSRSSLGYEHYDARIRCLVWSLVAALTSVNGRGASTPNLGVSSRRTLSRSVSCTNPCTNLVADQGVAVLTGAGVRSPPWFGSRALNQVAILEVLDARPSQMPVLKSGWDGGCKGSLPYFGSVLQVVDP
jgi:hypothetical protein